MAKLISVDFGKVQFSGYRTSENISIGGTTTGISTNFLQKQLKQQVHEEYELVMKNCPTLGAQITVTHPFLYESEHNETLPSTFTYEDCKREIVTDQIKTIFSKAIVTVFEKYDLYSIYYNGNFAY